MKLMNKLFAVLALLSIGSAAFGYTFSFNNKSKLPVTVSVRVRMAGAQPQEAVIQPMEGQAFAFAGAHCLESVLINGKEANIGTGISTCRDKSFDITTIGFTAEKGSVGQQPVSFELSEAGGTARASGSDISKG